MTVSTSNFTIGQAVIATTRYRGAETHYEGIVQSIKETSRGSFVVIGLEGDETISVRPVNVKAKAAPKGGAKAKKAA